MSKNPKEDAVFNELTILCDKYNLPYPERQYKFIKGRRFQADFCWVDQKVIIEYEGGMFGKSRHTTGVGYTNDCEKYNLAALNGYDVFRLTVLTLKTRPEWLDIIVNYVSKRGNVIEEILSP